MSSPEVRRKKRSRTPKNSHASTAIADISKLLEQMSDMQKKLETHRNEQLASKKVERKKVASQKEKNVASMKVKPRVASPQKVIAGTSRNDQRDYSDTEEDPQESESDDEEDEEQEGSVEEQEEGEVEGDEEIEDNDSGADDPFAAYSGAYGVTEQNGPPVTDSLANIFTDMLKVRMPREEEKEMFAKYKQPANVPMLQNPRVNDEIYKKLGKTSVCIDHSLRTTGDKIVQAMLVNAQLTDRLGRLKQGVLGETRKEVKALLDISMEAMKASTIALQENNQRRRENIRRDINPAFKELCNPPAEESTLLLGEDFQEKVKDLTQNKGLGLQLGLERKRDSRSHFLGQARFSPYGNRYSSQTQRTYGRGRQTDYRPRPAQSQSQRRARGGDKNRFHKK